MVDTITLERIDALAPWSANARTHSPKQIRQIADSIRAFGFTNPVLIDDADIILVGHGRVAAAKLLGLESVPTIRLSQMTEAQKRAYVIADNKLAMNAGWDAALLALELQYLSGLELDFELGAAGRVANLDVGNARSLLQDFLDLAGGGFDRGILAAAHVDHDRRFGGRALDEGGIGH